MTTLQARASQARTRSLIEATAGLIVIVILAVALAVHHL